MEVPSRDTWAPVKLWVALRTAWAGAGETTTLARKLDSLCRFLPLRLLLKASRTLTGQETRRIMASTICWVWT